MAALRAAAAKSVITPPVGHRMGQWGLRQGRSNGVHRHLYARALVLDDGATSVAIVTMDVVGISHDILERIRAHVLTLTGITTDRLLISSTHNHTTPDQLRGVPAELGPYAAVLVESVAGAVYEASTRLEPARLGFGAGDLAGWTVNRQYPRQPVDTSVGVLRVDSAAGRPIARVVNYACHGVCDGGQYLQWSGDLPGAMSAALEDWYPGSVGLFLQGAAGDVHPFDWWFGNWRSKHMHTHEDTETFGRTLAAEASRIAEGCATGRTVRLAGAHGVVELPRRQVSWTVAEADALHRRLVADLGPYRGDTWPKGTTTAIAALRFPQLYGSGANELRLAQDQAKPAVPAELQALRIGDLLISGSPGELYNELGQTLKQQVDPARTWVASFCNDYVGYISTRKPHDEIAAVSVDEIVDQPRCRRYYGTTTSPFAPDAGERLVDAAARLVKGLA
jgi:neutral ceramidase